MARSRNLKPAFFTDERLAELKPLARILFAGTWCIADREGRLEDRPLRIKVEVLPYDNCNVDRLLDELQRIGKIQRYEVDGVRYIQVLKFGKHQNPHIREHQSTIPPPPGFVEDRVGAPDEHGAQHSAEHSARPGNSGTSPADSLIPDSLSSDSPASDSRPERPNEAPASKSANVNGGEEIPLKIKSSSGQDWSNPAWVQATAELLGVRRRQNESFEEFADRTSERLKARVQASERENAERQRQLEAARKLAQQKS